MLSLRVSVQRTGRPSWRASQTTSTSSTPSALGAEAAADVRGDDAELTGLEPERARERRCGPGAASASRARR